MVVTPVAMPVNTPVPATIVPVAGVLLLQVPPVDVVVHVIVVAGHSVDGPPMVPGSGFTVTLRVRVHPFVGCRYVIVTTAALLPVITPDDAPIGASVVLLLLHVPPAGVLFSVSVVPTHRALVVGVNAVGCGFTVAIAVRIQPRRV